MATQIGIVKAIMGEVTATAADGSIRTLQAGDRVFANELISTGAGGAIEIEFADGSLMDLGRNSQAMLDSEIFDPNDTAVAEGTQDDVPDDVAAIQQALLEGEDPTEIGEATAAGAGVEGGNEGHEAVFVDYLNPAVTPDAGFDTIGVSNSYDLPEEDIIILDEEDPLVEESTPSTTATSVFVDEDDLGGEFLFAFVGPSGIQSAFETDTGLFSQFPFVFGNNDEAIGDDLPTNSPTTVTGNLNADFGTDGAGSVQFNPATAQPAGLTSGGEPVQFWVSADGSMLVGYILTVPDYEYDAQEAQGDFPEYAEIIFTAEIPDSGVTDFAFTLHGPLDQAPGGNENNLNIDLSYIISDSDGDTANGVLQINVDDDSPVIGEGQAPQPQLLRVNELQVEPRTTTVDEDDTENGVGNTDSPGDDSSFPFIMLPISFGADGPAEENPVEISAEGIVDQNGNPLTSNGEPLTFVWNPDTNTLEGSAAGETVIELSVYVNPFGGFTEVFINLQGNLDHPVGAEGESLGTEDDLDITLNFIASDADGDQAEGQFTFKIDDDMPVVNVTVGEFSAPSLTTQDAQTIGTNTDTATGSFAAAFGLTQDMGADDGGTTATLQYSLSVGQGMEDTGLTSNDNAISLEMEGDDIVGKAGEEVIFRISVDTDGLVTLTQYAEIDHLPEEIDEVNDNSNIGLPSGSIELTASAEIIDGDGDKAFDSETIDITDSLSFEDDVPVANDDGIFATSQDTAITLTVDTNDVEGADGVDFSDGTKVFVSTAASNGSVVYNNDGTFTYTPDEGFFGQDSFEYTITDGDNDTDTATVTVDVAKNSQPELTVSDSAVDETDGLDPVEGTLSVDFGVDTGELELSATGATWDGSTNTLTADDGSWKIVNNQNGTYTFTQLTAMSHLGAEDASLDIVVTATATDADNDVDVENFTITVYDDGPVVTDNDAEMVNEAGSLDNILNYDLGEDGLGLTGGLEISYTGPTITSGGIEVTFASEDADGDGIYDLVGTADGEEVIRIAQTLPDGSPEDGSYSIQMSDVIDIPFINIEIPLGSLDVDGDTGTYSLGGEVVVTLTGSGDLKLSNAGGSEKLGVGNNNMDPGETLTFDFGGDIANNLALDLFDNAEGYQFSYEATLADGSTFNSGLIEGAGNSNIEPINIPGGYTSITITVEDNGTIQQPKFKVSSINYDTQDPEGVTLDFGYSATDADGDVVTGEFDVTVTPDVAVNAITGTPDVISHPDTQVDAS